MTALNGARCVGLHGLFESTTRQDHIAARQLCAECPALTACNDLLTDVKMASSGGVGGMPTGTWAGKLIGQTGRVRR